MTTTSAPIGAPLRPDPTRTGAVWVTGTGAFLLLAAAAVFTAVRWDDIPGGVKLGALGLATGAFLVAGRRLAAGLPATAAALFHLGTFLVPVDVAAVCLRLELPWATVLLAQGAVATATFGWAASVERSVVLRWSTGAAVVVLAGGLGAVTGVPAPLLLAAAGIAAVARRAHGPAVAWAAVVGLAPLATLVQRELMTGAGVLDRLGLAPDRPLASALAAALAAVTMGVVAQRTDRLDLAVAAMAVGLGGTAASWAGADLGAGSTALALAAAFVGVELAALALGTDPFWHRPVDGLALAAEPVAAASLLALAGAAVDTWSDGPRPATALAAGLLAVGWIVADRRRGEAGTTGTTALVGTATVLAVALATTAAVAVAVALAAVTVAAVLADRRDGPAVAVLAGTAAPLAAWAQPGLAATTALVAAVAIAESAVRRSRSLDEADGFHGSSRDVAGGLALLSAAPLVLAAIGVGEQLGSVTGPLVALAVALTGLGAWLDRGQPLAAGLPLGTLVRAGTVGVLAGTAGLPAGELALVAGVAAALTAADAVRLRQPSLAHGTALALPVAVGALVHAAGLSLPSTGVALALAATVVVGLGSLLDRSWWAPIGSAATLCLGAGMALALPDPAALAHVLLIAGGLVTAVGTAVHRVEVQVVGGAAVAVGFWMRLAAAGVDAPEPYVLPVALLLAVVGTRALAEGTASSWVAYGPAIGLLGGTALIERIQGGAGWHGVVAGAVAVASVVVGGSRRLAGPLLLGTGLLVVLTGYESLAVTAHLPTWSWLAAGGAVLLGAGVAMERHEVGPIETGRRLVDVVAQRYR